MPLELNMKDFLRKNIFIIEFIGLIGFAMALFIIDKDLAPLSIIFTLSAGRKLEQMRTAARVSDLVRRLNSNPNKKMFSAKNWNGKAGSKYIVLRMTDILECMQSARLLMGKNEKK